MGIRYSGLCVSAPSLLRVVVDTVNLVRYLALAGFAPIYGLK